MTQLDSFIKAFGNASSGVRDMCNCGKVYYKNDEFDEDDEEVLGAFSLDCGVETITFEGKTYVRDCSCFCDTFLLHTFRSYGTKNFNLLSSSLRKIIQSKSYQNTHQ